MLKMGENNSSTGIRKNRSHATLSDSNSRHHDRQSKQSGQTKGSGSKGSDKKKSSITSHSKKWFGFGNQPGSRKLRKQVTYEEDPLEYANLVKLQKLTQWELEDDRQLYERVYKHYKEDMDLKARAGTLVPNMKLN